MSRGLSSVYGFIVIYLVTIAALEASSSTIGSLVSLQASHDRADQLESVQKIEHLSLTFSNGTLTVTNDGLVSSTVRYVHLTLASSSSDLALNQKISVGQMFQLGVRTAAAISAVTSLGNVFWVSSPTPVSGTGKYAIVFDATGVSSGASQVLAVDGTSYILSQLPLTFNWASGEIHTFAYSAGIASGTGTRVGWSDTRGLSTSQSGQITVKQSGQVIADYLTQYYLTVVGGGNVVTSPPSPMSDGWFNSGTTVYVTTNKVWGLVSNQSRDDLISWSVDAATPTLVARSGSGLFTTGGVVMNAPHTLTFNYAIQYYLSLQPSVASSGTVPALAFGYSYLTQYATPQILSNPGFESGSLSPWAHANFCAFTPRMVTSPVHSGSYAVQIEGSGQLSYYCWGLSQAVPVSLPPGAMVTSISASIWLYDSTGGDGAYVSITPSTGTCQSTTLAVLSAGTWTQLTTSVSGCSIQPSSIQFQADLNAGCIAGREAVIFCGNGYADDGVLSITYAVPSSGWVNTATASYALSGSSVTYTYSVANVFPPGTINRQLQTTIPGTEKLSQVLIGSGPNSLPPSQYGISGATLTIPDATIASYGGSFTLVTTASGTGTYSVTQSGSITNDNWYDSGSTATVSASANSPFIFSNWDGSPTIASPNSAQTTVTMNGYYLVRARFNVGP